jgi:hypothetical protein
VTAGRDGEFTEYVSASETGLRRLAFLRSLQIRVGADPATGVVDLFAHHVRLFGPNERNWTIQPIG